MPAPLLTNLAVGVAMTLVTALVVGPGWAYWVVGAVNAAVLALGVWIGTGPVATWTLAPRTYAAAATVALVVGLGAWWLSGADNGAFLGVGVVVGIATSIAIPIGARAAAGEEG